MTVLASVTSMLDEDGVFHGAFGMLTDITERKRAEEALAESESRYRYLFELESDAICLIDNETGDILEVNQTAEKLYGFSRIQLLAMKHTDLSAAEIAKEALSIAADICVYTNHNIKVEELD